MMREIRLALLEADVNLQVVKDFTKRVRERAVGAEVLESLSPAQQIVKIVDEELTITLGSETAELNKSPKIPTVIMMAGLQGAGKTTFTGKLANYLKKNRNSSSAPNRRGRISTSSDRPIESIRSTARCSCI